MVVRAPLGAASDFGARRHRAQRRQDVVEELADVGVRTRSLVHINPYPALRSWSALGAGSRWQQVAARTSGARAPDRSVGPGRSLDVASGDALRFEGL